MAIDQRVEGFLISIACRMKKLQVGLRCGIGHQSRG